MNTPEIQARIERLNREHPPAKGMEWRAVESGPALRGDYYCTGLVCHETMFPGASFVGADIGSYFRQVPAEAKEEGEPQIPEELYDGHAVFSAMDEKGKKRTGPENVSDVLDAVVRLIKRRIKERPTPAPEPGLDYERLKAAVDRAYGVAHHAVIESRRLADKDRASSHMSTALQLIEQETAFIREPKPEPDVAPDELTPRLTEVEFQRDGHSHWLIGHLLKLSSDKPTRFLVLANDNRHLWVPRCRLRREGK